MRVGTKLCIIEKFWMELNFLLSDLLHYSLGSVMSPMIIRLITTQVYDILDKIYEVARICTLHWLICCICQSTSNYYV